MVHPYCQRVLGYGIKLLRITQISRIIPFSLSGRRCPKGRDEDSHLHFFKLTLHTRIVTLPWVRALIGLLGDGMRGGLTLT